MREPSESLRVRYRMLVRALSDRQNGAFRKALLTQYRTNDADLPAGQQYQQWDAPWVREWAERVGPSAAIVVNRIFESVPVDEQGLDAALAVLRLPRRFSSERVEAACALVLTGPVRSPQYAHIQPIPVTGQDKIAALRPPRTEPDEVGGYVRGADYYARGAR